MVDNPIDLSAAAGSHPGTGKYAETFSPVTVTETTGTVFLGILSIILLAALLRAQARNRQLEVQLARGQGAGR